MDISFNTGSRNMARNWATPKGSTIALEARSKCLLIKRNIECLRHQERWAVCPGSKNSRSLCHAIETAPLGWYLTLRWRSLSISGNFLKPHSMRKYANYDSYVYYMVYATGYEMKDPFKPYGLLTGKERNGIWGRFWGTQLYMTLLYS